MPKSYNWPTLDFSKDKTEYVHHLSPKEAHQKSIQYVCLPVDPSLGPEAWAVLGTFMASYPDHRWNKDRLKHALPKLSHRDIETGLEELKTHGYLETRVARHNGTMHGHAWFVTAVPFDWPPALKLLKAHEQKTAKPRGSSHKSSDHGGSDHCPPGGNIEPTSSILTQSLSYGEGPGKSAEIPVGTRGMEEHMRQACTGDASVPITGLQNTTDSDADAKAEMVDRSAVPGGNGAMLAIHEVAPPYKWGSDINSAMGWVKDSILGNLFRSILPGAEWEHRAMRKFYKDFGKGRIGLLDLLTIARYPIKRIEVHMAQDLPTHSDLLYSWSLIVNVMTHNEASWAHFRKQVIADHRFCTPDLLLRNAVIDAYRDLGCQDFSTRFAITSSETLAKCLPGLAEICELGNKFWTMAQLAIVTNHLQHGIVEAFMLTDAQTAATLVSYDVIPQAYAPRVFQVLREKAVLGFAASEDDLPEQERVLSLLRVLP